MDEELSNKMEAKIDEMEIEIKRLTELNKKYKKLHKEGKGSWGYVANLGYYSEHLKDLNLHEGIK